MAKGRKVQGGRILSQGTVYGGRRDRGMKGWIYMKGGGTDGWKDGDIEGWSRRSSVQIPYKHDRVLKGSQGTCDTRQYSTSIHI